MGATRIGSEEEFIEFIGRCVKKILPEAPSVNFSAEYIRCRVAVFLGIALQAGVIVGATSDSTEIVANICYCLSRMGEKELRALWN